MQCEGLSRATGERCKRHAVKGRKYCPMHGGNTLMGAAHPRYVQGNYTRAVPPRLRDKYQALLENAEQLTLTHEITLLESRLEELVERIGSGDTQRTWKDIHTTWLDFMRAIRKGDTAQQQALLPEINQLVTKGYGESQAWIEMSSLISQIARLKNDERRRIVEARQVTGVDHVMALLTANLDAITKSVQRHADEETAAAILRDAARIYAATVG